MTAELRAEKFGVSQTDASLASHCRMGLPGLQTTANARVFDLIFRIFLPGKPGLSPTQLDSYLADLPCLDETESAVCEGPVTEEDI